MRLKNKGQGGKVSIATLGQSARGGWLAVALGVAGVVSVLLPRLAVAQSGKATEIWLQPNSPYEAKGFAKLSGDPIWLKNGTDFWHFFSSANDANPILKDIKVIKFSPTFVGSASKAEMESIYKWLHQHNIQLAVGIEMLTPMAGGCGRHLEGFSASDDSVNGFLYKLKHTGADVAYFVMDEPLDFGSEVKARGACQASFEQTAENILSSVKKIKALFPNAQIGEVEGVPHTTNLAKWLAVYHSAMGSYPSVFFADVYWRFATDKQLESWSAITRQHHIRFGVIYNAGEQKTSEEWAVAAQTNIKRIISDPNIHVDIALFQSWLPQPFHLLPANQVGTMSNMIQFYEHQN